MKKLFLAVLALTSISLSPAMAGVATTYDAPPPEVAPQKGGLYVAIFGGLNVHQTADVNDIAATEIDLESDTGWFAGLKLGYVFPTEAILKPVIEVEGFYNGVEAQYETDAGFEFSSDFHSGVFMVNAMLKFDLGRFQPYLGGGIGYAHVWANEIEVDEEEIEDTERDGGTFAYQGIAGVEFHVSDRLGVFGEYKALVLDEVVGLENYLNHLVGVGLRFGF